jgi:type I restriction enzyme, S subunit
MLNSELPVGWEWSTLGEIADLLGGGTPSRKNPEYFTGDIVWLTPTEIPKTKISVISESREKITQDGLRRSSARLIPQGSVLMTSRASIGYVAIAGTEVTTNQGFASFIPKQGINNFYLAYWLWANAEFFIEQATGTTFKEITKSKLRNFSLPIPPLPEQERIVNRIEELFSDLEAGVAALKRVRAGLKRYKASVLKAACEGKLLDKGGIERSDGLPEEWRCVTLGELIQHLTSGSRGWAKYYSEDGSLFIRVGNFERLSKTLNLAKIIFVTEPDGAEANRTRLQLRDLLITMTADVGMIGVVDENTLHWRIAYINQHVGLVRLSEPEYVDFVAYALASEIGQQQFRKKQYGATKLGINFEDINSLEIPLPPLEEQRRIVAEVEQRLSVVSEVESAVEASLVRAGRLRQAILRSAFEGRLI